MKVRFEVEVEIYGDEMSEEGWLEYKHEAPSYLQDGAREAIFGVNDRYISIMVRELEA